MGEKEFQIINVYAQESPEKIAYEGVYSPLSEFEKRKQEGSWYLIGKSRRLNEYKNNALDKVVEEIKREVPITNENFKIISETEEKIFNERGHGIVYQRPLNTEEFQKITKKMRDKYKK